MCSLFPYTKCKHSPENLFISLKFRKGQNLTNKLHIICSFQSHRCPRLTHPQDEEEILIPVGHSQSIKLSAVNLPIPEEGQGYQCLLHEREPLVLVPATRINENTVECQEREVRHFTGFFCPCFLCQHCKLKFKDSLLSYLFGKKLNVK